MYDLAMPNDKPGQCCKCKGSGVYSWGPSVNGNHKHSGPCHSCRGTGRQDQKQIKRNQYYNIKKIESIHF